MNENVEKVQSIVAKQNAWRKRECVNLIASENVTSPLVDAAYHSDFLHRYAEGDPFKRFYNGTKYIDEIEEYANTLAKDVFRAKNVDLRPISGTVANIAAFSMFMRPSDIIFSNSTAGGGHITHNPYGAAGLLRTEVNNFPVTEDGFHVDVDKSVKQMRFKASNVRNHLSTVVLGCSLFLFPQPVKEISDVAHEVGAKVIYDAAHVLGLIVGGQFQDPLGEGADVVVTSTHKTFFGPQGGAIFNNLDAEYWEKCRSMIFPGVTSNHHLHRIPAMALALLEFQEFGKEYAAQVCKNAKALAQALHENGFDVKCEAFGFTQSHQCAVDFSTLGGGLTVADKLEESNIIVNKNLLPGEKITSASLVNPSGVRIGVQEMTRWGMKEGDMVELAGIFKRVVFDEQNQKNEVIELRKRFSEVKYTFA